MPSLVAYLAARRARRLAERRRRVLAAAVVTRDWVSVADIAAGSSLSVAAVRAAVAELEAVGLLESRMESALLIRERSPRRIYWPTPRARKLLNRTNFLSTADPPA